MRAFPVTLTEADLVRRYSRENVISQPVFGVDDGPQDGVVLFPNTDDTRLELRWQQNGTKGLLWVKALGSRWTTTHGISVGTTLRAVERINRAPFRLAGFHTEGGGGRVRSWANGRIGEAAARDLCETRIQFQPRLADSENHNLFRQVRFGREYSSGHPALQQLNPSVVVIWLTYLSP